MVGGKHVALVGDLFTYSVCNPKPRALVAYMGFILVNLIRVVPWVVGSF